MNLPKQLALVVALASFFLIGLGIGLNISRQPVLPCSEDRKHVELRTLAEKELSMLNNMAQLQVMQSQADIQMLQLQRDQCRTHNDAP